MKCPRHHSDLNQQTINSHEIDQCPDCEGLWIPGSAIDHLLGPGERLKLRSLCSVKQSALLCPADNHPLYEGKIGPVVVDLCLHCNGLWLDPGELEILRLRKPPTPHVRSNSSVGIEDHSVGASEELILYGLLGLF